MGGHVVPHGIVCKGHEQIRLKPHRASRHASPASYARPLFVSLGIGLREDDDSRQSFGGGRFQGGNGAAHHRASGDHFPRVFRQSSCIVDDFGEGSAVPDDEISRILQVGSGHGDHSFRQVLPIADSVVDGIGGCDIVDDTSCLYRQASGWDCLARQCVDQLFFPALRIFFLEFFDPDIGVFPCGLFHGGDCFRFVFLDADYSLRSSRGFHDKKGPGHYFVGLGSHKSVIASQARFTLCAVDYHGGGCLPASPTIETISFGVSLIISSSGRRVSEAEPGFPISVAITMESCQMPWGVRVGSSFLTVPLTGL